MDNPTTGERIAKALAQVAALLFITFLIAWTARNAIVNFREGDIFWACWFGVMAAAFGGRFVYRHITGEFDA